MSGCVQTKHEQTYRHKHTRGTHTDTLSSPTHSLVLMQGVKADRQSEAPSQLMSLYQCVVKVFRSVLLSVGGSVYLGTWGLALYS